jgi:hypothetical protein
VNDAINNPKHYNTGKIEVIEFIEDQRLGMHLGNTVKYICRAGRKDKAKVIEDLEKAAWYLARKIERLKAVRDGRAVTRPNAMHPTFSVGGPGSGGSMGSVPEHPNCRCVLFEKEVLINNALNQLKRQAPEIWQLTEGEPGNITVTLVDGKQRAKRRKK